MHNIEKSAFKRGEYVGYLDGAWRIKKDSSSGFWWAYPPAGTNHKLFHARTLREISEALDMRQKNPLSRVKIGSKSMATGKAPSKRLRKRRAKTEALPAGYYANPLTRVKVRSPSQRPSLPVVAEHGDPSPRLVKRREKTAKLKRPGAYANPAPFAEVEWANLVHYLVQAKGTYHTRWSTRGVFKTKADAHDYAHALHRADDSLTIRVVSGK